MSCRVSKDADNSEKQNRLAIEMSSRVREPGQTPGAESLSRAAAPCPRRPDAAPDHPRAGPSIDFEIWLATYRPVENRNSPEFAEESPVHIFETFGDDLAFVERLRTEDSSVSWALVEGDTGDWTIEGFHRVNRLAYLVATALHTGGPVDVHFS
jgi:hypothetical protein